MMPRALMLRLRLVAMLARPAVIVLLVLCTATGAAERGVQLSGAGLILALTAVLGFLLFSVACNDIADEAIDRVNLPGRRPLAAGLLGRREFAVIGATAGVAALAAAAWLGWAALAVLAGGLAVSAGYSLRPVRLADRGAVASLVLPACYVAVPYLLGAVAAGRVPAAAGLRPGSLGVLGGLYLGFTGRLLLKDFRDVRGDALFGKRTFLVRHGRAATCLFSGCCWIAGTAVILACTARLTGVLAAVQLAGLAGVLTLLAVLSRNRGGRREEAIITAIAIISRAMVLMLLAHLAMRTAAWNAVRYDLVMAGLAGLTATQVVTMLRYGPAAGLRAPDWPGASDATQSSATAGRREVQCVQGPS